jgi:hypothetical protein
LRVLNSRLKITLSILKLIAELCLSQRLRKPKNDLPNLKMLLIILWNLSNQFSSPFNVRRRPHPRNRTWTLSQLHWRTSTPIHIRVLLHHKTSYCLERCFPQSHLVKRCHSLKRCQLPMLLRLVHRLSIWPRSRRVEVGNGVLKVHHLLMPALGHQWKHILRTALLDEKSATLFVSLRRDHPVNESVCWPQ